MALHTKKEFATLCGLKTKDVAVYVNRGKVVYSGDYIDGALALNAEFLKMRQSKLGIEQTAGIITAGPIVKKPKFKDPEKPNISTTDMAPSDNQDLLALEKQKVILTNEKTTEQIAILKVKKDQLHGELIPTDLVKSLIVLQSESSKIAFNEACENLIVIIAQKKQLSNAEVADIRKQLIGVINKAIDNSVNSSKKSLKNIVKEYSSKKGVGEKTS